MPRFHNINGQSVQFSADRSDNFSSMQLVSQDVDAMKFVLSTGNIVSGEIVMYGMVNS